jgi:Cu+-exporting ATPase
MLVLFGLATPVQCKFYFYSSRDYIGGGWLQYCDRIPFDVLTFIVWIGKIFYIHAYKALKQKRANMEVLVALGTSAAYFYSLISAILEIFLEDYTSNEYFETSVLLITYKLLLCNG